jgi:hypothetical protein
MILPEDIQELANRKPEELFKKLREEEPYLYMMTIQAMNKLKNQTMDTENLVRSLGLVISIYILMKEAKTDRTPD